MATGVAAAAPSPDIAAQKITLSPVGSPPDTEAKLVIESIGISNPIPDNTLQGHGQGIYSNILA
jgi:hypothetical protein